ncbi:uncharacterized protein LOC111718001 [Eurytemora carolleeae]|uniref:uncharacterized protein LOC111718001 n=1 Tax=Eurytemora carolleeae TaxID=1294199 RepID=UPI000C792C2C|nr:uncharacterized protein LOC111718001 [Eurytemora carolleeae]|eukprot:XP_023349234.1 uncharacterized protein LOC111718001 [Eurytemora affinis]
MTHNSYEKMDRLAGLFKRSSESGDRSCRGVGGEAVRGVGGEGEDGVDDGDLEDGSKNRKNQKIYNNSAIPSISWNVFRHEGVTEDLDSIGNFSSSTAFTDLVDIMSKHRIKYHSPHNPPGTESNFWNLVKWQFLFVSLLTFFWCLALFLYLSLVDPFEPRPQPTNPYSSLISFRHGGSGDWEVLNSRIKEFIKGYSFGERIGASSVCNWNTTLTKDFRYKGRIGTQHLPQIQSC